MGFLDSDLSGIEPSMLRQSARILQAVRHCAPCTLPKSSVPKLTRTFAGKADRPGQGVLDTDSKKSAGIAADRAALGLPPAPATPAEAGEVDFDDEDEDDDEMEEMYQDGPSLGMKEWGGPTRGGRLAEPIRFGDWERNGRCSDF